MGLARGAMRLLLDECVREKFFGSVATLGRQHIYFRIDQLQKCADERGVKLTDVEVRLHRVPQLAGQHFISDDTFLRAIGFSEVAALDFSDYEQPDVLVDLNTQVPLELHGRFDVIIDGGTLEHVFHLPQALKNLHLMLRPGGRVIHLSPSSNYLDHGFYMFSPTLFWDFYSVNEYDIRTAKLIRHTADHSGHPWEISTYIPGSLDPVAFGGLDDSMYGVFFVATKTANSTGDRIPQQGYYLKTWHRSVVSESVSISRGDRLLERTKGIPVVGPFARFAVQFYRSNRPAFEAAQRFFRRPRRGSRLKVIAKY